MKSDGTITFNSFYLYRKLFDQLPSVPQWSSKTIRVNGKATRADGQVDFEEVEMWKRDPVCLVQEILENPELQNEIRYKPFKLYTDNEKTERIYNEMWTGDWWNEKAVSERIH